MSRPLPHPQSQPITLFSLIPLNERAKAVLEHPSNRHLVSTLQDGTLALDIKFDAQSRSPSILATLGRGEADIVVEGAAISKVQCSFEIDLETGVVMLYDRSHGQTTQVSGGYAFPFKLDRLRKVVVQRALNDVLGMGGAKGNLVCFQLRWHTDRMQTVERIKSQQGIVREESARLARTVLESDRPSLSYRETRVHVSMRPPLNMRYLRGRQLGAGQFGAVYEALNVDTGQLMAVKLLERPREDEKQAGWEVALRYALKREIETLSQIRHPHIVDYIASQNWDGPGVEIFMGLKEGNLSTLVRGWDSPITDLAKAVFHQMLQALDFLAAHGILHRDVKPENILYVTQPDGQYLFQLGDFGLCNRVANNGDSFVGSMTYVAPEVYHYRPQTSKVDVWSLFVTMLWTLDVGGFRRNQPLMPGWGAVERTVTALAAVPPADAIREMARVDADERASAAQMLVRWFDGEGLTTPRGAVPPIAPSEQQASSAAATPRVTSLRPSTQAQRLPRAGVYRAADLFRVHKPPASGRRQKMLAKRLEQGVDGANTGGGPVAFG